jgi:uncharacterized protein (TIGR03437 family)
VGIILDDSGKPVLLRGLNRSATASGNADATATDQDYAAQNHLLSMNLVRLFVNSAWWTANMQIPAAGMAYQDYIDLLIQRAKKYGNYVLILDAGQIPATANTIDAAFTFWAAFAKKYAADPAILYDTWEDSNMPIGDGGAWSDGQNELIATIRTYSPQSLIFVEDSGTAFESIVSGALPDPAWPNVVWNFHLYAGPSGACSESPSPRYLNWPQNFDPLVIYAQQHSYGVAITEWGGCNDSEPYHTNITSYAQAHSVALAYFDSSYLIAQSGGAYQLTAVGTKVAQAYTAIAAGGPGAVTSVSSANGAATLAPEAIAIAFGANLSLTQQVAAVPLPTNLGGTTVLIKDANGISRPAELFYAYPTQLSYEVPPGVATGAASVTVSVNGDPVAFGMAQIATVAPGLYTANEDGKGAAAAIVVTVHGDGSSGFAYTFQCASAGNCTPLPIDLGLATDRVVLELFGTGIRGYRVGVACNIGSATLPVAYAGPQGVYAGFDQVNVPLPASLRGSGNVTVLLTVDGQPANPVNLTFK